MHPVFGVTLDLPFLDDVSPQLIGIALAVLSYIATGIRLARRIIARDRLRLDRQFGSAFNAHATEGLAGATVLLAWPLVLAATLTCRAACLAGKGLAWLAVPPEKTCAVTATTRVPTRSDTTTLAGDDPARWHLHTE